MYKLIHILNELSNEKTSFKLLQIISLSSIPEVKAKLFVDKIEDRINWIKNLLD